MIKSRPLKDEEAFQVLFHDRMLLFRGAMPGIIQGLVTNDLGDVWAVDVQPAIGQYVSSDGKTRTGTQDLPLLTNVPLMLPYSASSNLSLTTPLKKGDDCIIVCADRSIDDWQYFGGQRYPVESTITRQYSINDAMCVSGVLTNITPISNYSTDRMEIRNKDATVSVSVGSDDVIIKSSSGTITVSDDITIEKGSTTITLNGSTVSIDASAQISLTAPIISLNGDVSVSGSFTADDGNFNGIPFTTHVHSDPQGGVTGPPE